MANFATPLMLVALLVVISGTFHYLVFHTFVEYFTIFVSLGISFVAYYTYPFTKNRYILFIGIGYLWVAVLDILHTHTYQGMPFNGIDSSNVSIVFWVFSRIFEAFIILSAPFMRFANYKIYKVSLFFLSITLIITIVSMYYTPALITPSDGLTPLKIGLEYFIVAILLLALYVNKLHVAEFSKVVYRAIKYAIILTILSELSFTLYVDLYGLMNLVGHIFKFLSFWVLLQAIIKVSLQEPFALMQKGATTYEVIPYPALIIDKQGVIRQINRAARDSLGKKECEIIGEKNHNLFHPRSIAEDSCPICEAIRDLKELKNCVLEDKEFNTFKQYSLSPIQSSKDSTTGMVQLIVDITHTVRLKQSLLEQYKLLQNIIDTVPMRIFWKDKEGVYLGANNLFIQDLKLSSVNELVGKSESDLMLSIEEIERIVKDDKYIMKSKEPKLQYEDIKEDESGKKIFVSASKVPLMNDKDEVIGVVGTYEDITKRKNLEEELQKQQDILRYQAHYDLLTHLPNRTLFHDRLLHAIDRAKLNNTQIALFLIDFDQFKQINDTMGHQVGDEILKIFANRLKSLIHQDDTLARLGGDEFIIITENLESSTNASILAQKIIDSAKQSINYDEHTLYISASIGISLYPKDSQDIHDLLKYADSAMYKAKEQGRNNFQFYSSEMTQIAINKVTMLNDLRTAIKNEEFVVYYQPQMEIFQDSEVLAGVEALVRWEHPVLGQIQPFKFISIAEESGIIIEIDKLVMKMAIRQIMKWHDEGLNPGVLSLNLAMKLLQQDDFIPLIKKIIDECGCKDKKYLSFEITEGELMANPQSSIEKLNALRELGIEIAIDDFGTGYSSLSYLKQLPISKLKIDQSFTQGIPDDRDDVVIVKTIIALAKNLNMKVLAEGVETLEQKEFMYENGCYEIQGYFYSKPIPSDEMREFILLHQRTI